MEECRLSSPPTASAHVEVAGSCGKQLATNGYGYLMMHMRDVAVHCRVTYLAVSQSPIYVKGETS